MPTSFSAILDDFESDMMAIVSLVHFSNNPILPARSRVVTANASILLLAATFEEFVREMARETAREVVAIAGDIEYVPRSLVIAAWKETLGHIASKKVPSSDSHLNYYRGFRSQIDDLLEFTDGNIGKDIYEHIAHNQNNMRPAQINALFKVSGLGNVVKRVADQPDLQTLYGSADSNSNAGKLERDIESFFDQRNKIAHDLNAGSSPSVGAVEGYIALFTAFSKSLANDLNNFIDSLHAANQQATTAAS